MVNNSIGWEPCAQAQDLGPRPHGAPQPCGSIESTGPCFARGTKAAGLDLVAFLTSSSHCFSAIRPCFYVFRGPKYPVDLRPQFKVSGSVCIIKNPSIFKSVSKAQKTRKAAPKASKKQQNPTPKSIKRFPWKADFCNAFCAKTLICKSQSPKFRFRNR